MCEGLLKPSQASVPKESIMLSWSRTLVMSWCCTHQLLNTYFEIHLGIICIAVGKKQKNMEGLKTVQPSTVVVTLLYSTMLDNLHVKGSIPLDFLFFIAK